MVVRKESMCFKHAISLIMVSTMLISLSACGGAGADTGNNDQAITSEDISKVLSSDKKIRLTLWSWAPQYEKSIKEFQKKYPNITIDYAKQTGSTPTYTKLQNALTAKSGIPDVMQMEYDLIPQFAALGALKNFASKSIEDDIGSLYNKSAWQDVHYADGLYGIPSDQGPTVSFYRKDILDQYGLDIPTTWDEYESTGIALHKKDPSKYLGYFFLDVVASPFTTMLNYADAKPWSVSGKKSVELNLQNSNVREVSDFIQRLIEENVLKPVSPQSDEYGQGLSRGEVVSLISGAWMGGALESNFPDLSGKWQAALPPSWTGAQQSDNGTYGGSAFVVSSTSSRDKQIAALAFAHWLGSDPTAVEAESGGGLLMAANSYQNDAEALAVTSDYFGGQRINEVYFNAAKAVSSNVPNLPFMQYANTAYTDNVVPALDGKHDVFAAVEHWQKAMSQWASEQGYEVSIK